MQVTEVTKMEEVDQVLVSGAIRELDGASGARLTFVKGTEQKTYAFTEEEAVDLMDAIWSSCRRSRAVVRKLEAKTRARLSAERERAMAEKTSQILMPEDQFVMEGQTTIEESESNAPKEDAT